MSLFLFSEIENNYNHYNSKTWEQCDIIMYNVNHLVLEPCHFKNCFDNGQDAYQPKSFIHVLTNPSVLSDKSNIHNMSGTCLLNNTT